MAEKKVIPPPPPDDDATTNSTKKVVPPPPPDDATPQTTDFNDPRIDLGGKKYPVFPTGISGEQKQDVTQTQQPNIQQVPQQKTSIPQPQSIVPHIQSNIKL